MTATAAPALPRSAAESFRRRGYYLRRGLFPRRAALEAARWLKAQDPRRLVKNWTETEPAVPLAVYSVVHAEKTPIARLAQDAGMLRMAGALMGAPVYLWASKVNLKAAWCGTVEYYHQDLVYWKDRGYPKDEMLSCMIFLEPHGPRNAGLNVFPGSHRGGLLRHESFININGLSKFMIPPETLDRLHRRHGFESIEAAPGDALFFHSSLVHGSSHNSSPIGRMVILSQLNTVGNEPRSISRNAKSFNLRRVRMELAEARRREKWFRQKYERQKCAAEPTFLAPIPEHERR